MAAEFDDVAVEYGRQIEENRINRLLRERSLEVLRPAFRDAHRLLEIGCGSGIETLPMLNAGHEILCVDLSTAMLEVVRRRARAAGVSEALETRPMAAGDLGRLVAEVGPGAFDGAYSTYGALNCEPDLRPVGRALAELLPARRRFVAGVYNRWCLVELLGYGLTGRWRRAFGRRPRPIEVGSSRYGVDIFAYSPGDLFRSWAPEFRATDLRAVPAILPPFDLVEYAEKFSRRFDTLARWDARLARKRPFSYLGDHFLAVLERTGAG
ncbi:methyltransferase [mine drainage metagenome]|uniref:Methyltransferase n=1 Tax=mine drainage metagenome TaxID=410659 RepID=T1B9H6_9ZZZZ